MSPRGFRVIDATGTLKITSLGAAATLPDPVTVAHAGTGLTSVAKGDILYTSADGVFSKLAIDTAATRILTSAGDSTYLVPKWEDPQTGLGLFPRQISRKSAWSTADLGAGTTTWDAIWALTHTGNTALVDTTADWIRYATPATTDTVRGTRVNVDWAWADHLPLAECLIRTGPDITALRFSFLISNTATLPTSADDQSALKGFGIRYSTVAGDTGFTPWAASGAVQTTGTVIASIAANTIYVLSMEATSTTSARFKVNDSAYQTLAIPAGALGTALRLQLSVATTTNSVKLVDMAALYGECN